MFRSKIRVRRESESGVKIEKERVDHDREKIKKLN